VFFVQVRADVSILGILPVTSLYKTDVETCGDFDMSKSNLRGVSGHIADNEVQYQILFYNPMQSRGSAWFLQHKGRKGGECGRPKSNQHFKPSVQEEIPQTKRWSMAAKDRNDSSSYPEAFEKQNCGRKDVIVLSIGNSGAVEKIIRTTSITLSNSRKINIIVFEDSSILGRYTVS
jgi:hypothetical protein